MTAASEIIAHYRAKGLRFPELVAAIERHGRLLSGLDPTVAKQLERAARRIRR